MTSAPPNPWRPERINPEGLHFGEVMSTLAPLLDGGQRTKVLAGRQCGPKIKGEPIPDPAPRGAAWSLRATSVIMTYGAAPSRARG
jgi:hypothetical protein